MIFDRYIPYAKLIIFMILLITGECKKKRNRKKEQYNDEPPKEEYNICNVQQPTIIYCYCDTLEYNEAVEGNCWIFNDTSDEEYTDVWEGFSSQNHIKQFTLHLRPDGTVNNIPTVAIMHLKELLKFEIQYATISTVHSFAFANSTTISKISISRNGIKVLEPNSFSNLANLTTLSLGENHLTEINRDVFTSLPKLTHLFIDRNNITRIADYAFHDLRNLKELELFSNQIRVIVPATFIGLDRVESLYLQKNWIEVIGDKTFQYLKSLKVLDLHGNSIKYIAPKAFYDLSKLRKLYLQDNKLLSLGSDVFISTVQLIYLDLSQNVLETLSEDAIRPIKKSLHHQNTVLALKGNIFRCDTRLQWIFNLYNTTKSRMIRDNLQEVYCYLESGTLPPRLENDPMATPIYEVTTLGIGPRAQLLKLKPSELPDPLIRTPATFTEDCDEEELKSTVKTKNKKQARKRKLRMRKQQLTTPTPTLLNGNKTPQNDMAPRSSDASQVAREMRPAAPVQESMPLDSSSIKLQVTALCVLSSSFVWLLS